MCRSACRQHAPTSTSGRNARWRLRRRPRLGRVRGGMHDRRPCPSLVQGRLGDTLAGVACRIEIPRGSPSTRGVHRTVDLVSPPPGPFNTAGAVVLLGLDGDPRAMRWRRARLPLAPGVAACLGRAGVLTYRGMTDDKLIERAALAAGSAAHGPVASSTLTRCATAVAELGAGAQVQACEGGCAASEAIAGARPRGNAAGSDGSVLSGSRRPGAADHCTPRRGTGRGRSSPV